MNVITISNLGQLNEILNDLLCLSGKDSEEIYHNMWCIALEGDLIERITLKQLQDFVDELIKNRVLQVEESNFSRSAVFYIWFDQQALQLRFNVITNKERSLPFGCKVQLHTTPEPILNNFLNTVRDVARHGDQIESFNNKELSDEDESKKDYVLDVFVKQLRAGIEA